MVFDKRYVTLSDSHFGTFSGNSTMSDSNDTSLECPFERTCNQKLGISSIPGCFHLWDFFSAASSTARLENYHKIAKRDHVPVPKFWLTQRPWANTKMHISRIRFTQ